MKLMYGENERHRGSRSKQRIWGACNCRKGRCQCVQKNAVQVVYQRGTRKSCEGYGELPPKCSLSGQYLKCVLFD